MNQPPSLENFLKRITGTIMGGGFIKLSLGGYAGGEPDLKKITVRNVIVKKSAMLGFTYSYKNRDIVKNYAHAEALKIIADYLSSGFSTATLFTTDCDLSYECLKNGKIKLRESAPTQKQISTAHDKQKKRSIAGDKSYLHDLGITDAAGQVLKTSQDKYRQINRYIEILDPHLQSLAKKEKIRVADMGAGKGYLTFALYDHLVNNLKIPATVTGIEARADMVSLCNDIAAQSGFAGLKFVQGTIDNYTDKNIDMLVALHACDTATDDAIYHGIESNADIIVVAPCCHKQIRREMEKNGAQNDLESLTRHGIFLERQAEMVTDSLRALLLEYSGYNVKVMEFISSEHTAKNILIIAEKNPKMKRADTKILEKIKSLQNYFGIKSHHLAKKLAV